MAITSSSGYSLFTSCLGSAITEKYAIIDSVFVSPMNSPPGKSLAGLLFYHLFRPWGMRSPCPKIMEPKKIFKIFDK
jgi:hypothetical protein